MCRGWRGVRRGYFEAYPTIPGICIDSSLLSSGTFSLTPDGKDEGQAGTKLIMFEFTSYVHHVPSLFVICTYSIEAGICWCSHTLLDLVNEESVDLITWSNVSPLLPIPFLKEKKTPFTRLM